MSKATARERCASGTQWPIRLMEAGMTAATPAPSAMRAQIKVGSEIRAAGRVSAANKDHQTTAISRTTLPPYRFDSAPLTSMSAMCRRKKRIEPGLFGSVSTRTALAC